MPEPELFLVTKAPLDLMRAILTVQERTAAADPLAGRQVADAGVFGAVASFVGLVRGHNHGRRVIELSYEAYEPLAARVFAQIAGEARDAWPGARLVIHHRIGTVPVGEASVVIAAASPHRAEAFAACRFAIERIKQIAPIWKRERFEGGDEWIEGAVADPEDAGARAEARRLACA